MERRYVPPPRIARVLGNRLTTLLGNPVLEVAGRVSGRIRSVPVNVLPFEGERYLVAPRGDTDWSRNLRAAGTGRLRTRAGTEDFVAEELADHEKPPIIAEYRRRWDSATRGQWEALPDPGDHPIFRVRPS